MSNIIQIRPLGFQWQTLDPFLFCVHHEDKFPKGNSELGPNASLAGRNIGQDFTVKDGWRMYHGEKVPGFPGHPHRGFETITIVREGIVDHADSAGGLGRYGNGDVQWMTAGRGLLHSEMFPLLNQDFENPLELFQIWLNLPKKNKMVEPEYKMFWSEDIPFITEIQGVQIEVLAGEILGVKSPNPPINSWAADEKNGVGIFNIQLEANTTFNLPAAAAGINRTLFFYKGNALMIDGETIPNYHAIDVVSDENISIQSGEGITKILILQGKPINEPIAQHGPFVMNSQAEIMDAFNEYRQTQFGGWPFTTHEKVHDINLGRFARYTDGSEEVK